MSQISTRSCSNCRTTIPENMRFCPNCGTSVNAESSEPTKYSSSGENFSLTPPPPPVSYSQAQNTPPFTEYPPQNQQGYRPSSPEQQRYPSPSSGQQEYQLPLQNIAQPPVYIKPQKDSSKRVLGQIGCGVGVVLLLIVLVLGTAGYFGYRWLTSAASNTGNITSTSPGGRNGNNGSNGNTPAAIPAVTAQINAQITYSSVDITILNVQKASSFSDDTDTSSPILVRLNVKEHNPTTSTVYLAYGDNYRLILPDGTSANPGNEHDSGGIDQAVTRTNWIDFSVSSSVDLSKLTLRLGAASQAQMDVPLTGNADLSKYQLKTTSPNTTFQYAGLKWTLTTVTSNLSADGKQADSGMRYIVVTLKIDNPTADVFYPSTSDNIRLQVGSTTNPPTSETTPLDSSIAAGTTNSTGTITFQMQQSSGSFTLIMLARTDTTPPAAQYTTIFQI